MVATITALILGGLFEFLHKERNSLFFIQHVENCIYYFLEQHSIKECESNLYDEIQFFQRANSREIDPKPHFRTNILLVHGSIRYCDE
jgi:hypothetical protein